MIRGCDCSPPSAGVNNTTRHHQHSLVSRRQAGAEGMERKVLGKKDMHPDIGANCCQKLALIPFASIFRAC